MLQENVMGKPVLSLVGVVNNVFESKTIRHFPPVSLSLSIPENHFAWSRCRQMNFRSGIIKSDPKYLA